MSDSAFLAPVGDGTWTSGTGTIAICNVDYLLHFDRKGCKGCDGPCLTLTNTTGSPVTYTATRDCCGCDYAIFAIGDPAVCTGTNAEGGRPCANITRIKVAWSNCTAPTCEEASFVDLGESVEVTSTNNGFAEPPAFWKMNVTGGTLYHCSWSSHSGLFTFNGVGVSFRTPDCSNTESGIALGSAIANPTDDSGCFEFTPPVDGCICILLSNDGGEGALRPPTFIRAAVSLGPCPLGMGAGATAKAAPAAPPPPRVALPTLTTCAHLGDRIPGQPCGSQLMRCNLHGDLTTRFTRCSAAARHCATCPDRTTDAHVARLQAIAKAPPPYPGGSGACVLTVGGGKYWPGVVVLAKMLRDTGSTLPVQVWYRGSVEEVRPEQVAGLGVELIDIESYPEWRDRPSLGDQSALVGNATVDKDGWRVKLFALARTQYETVLYLDADAYPVADPAPLLDLAREHGFCFWEDISDGSAHWWRAVWPRGKGTTVPIQGGQLAIHRPSVWREIALAAQMNTDAAHYYRHVHGDQDTWRVAFAITGRVPLRLGKAPWQEVAFVCDLDGRPMIVHRVRCKMLRAADITLGPGEKHGQPFYEFPREARAWTHAATALADEKPEAVFPTIYARDIWRGGSGAGSTDREAAPFVAWVNAEAARRGWASCVDVGCGDGRVSDRLGFAAYTGLDIVPVVQQRNRQRRPDRTWITADVTDVAAIPAADVLLCKDVLHHWPSAMVRKWLAAVVAAGKWKAVVVTVDRHQQDDGADCPLGGYRALAPDLDPLRPFGFTTDLEFAHKSILVRDL